MEQELSFKEWLIKAAVFLVLLGSAASIHAFLNGGMDAVVTLHNPSNPIGAVGTILLFASFGWLIFLFGGYVRKLHRVRSPLPKASQSVLAGNIAARLRKSHASLSGLAVFRGKTAMITMSLLALGVTGSALVMTQLRERPAYALTSLYQNNLIEFSSMEKCQQFIQKRFGKKYEKQLCFEK